MTVLRPDGELDVDKYLDVSSRECVTVQIAAEKIVCNINLYLQREHSQNAV